VVDRFEQIRSGKTLSSETFCEFTATGFITIPKPLTDAQFRNMCAAYDDLMVAAHGPDLKIASTTDRMRDVLSFSAAFDEVFLAPSLLELCGQFINEPFKLSSLIARTLRAGTSAQELHADLPRDSEDGPLLGFILMVDPFLEVNGATRFVPGSHCWPNLPSDLTFDTRASYPGEVLSCGEAGTMIVFNAAIWHGHTANVTSRVRRSIQGHFVRRNAKSGFDFASRLSDQVKGRMGPLARHLLTLD
jgi:hypothetical protein